MEEKVFDGKIMETNGWILIDSSSYKYQKKYGEHFFQFIQYVWVEPEDENPNKEYMIQIDDINLEEYTRDDLECYVSDWHGSINGIREKYTKPVTDEERQFWIAMGWPIEELEEIESIPWTKEDTEEVIAECVFDNTVSYEEEYGLLTEEEAQKIIVDYIRNN